MKGIFRKEIVSNNSQRLFGEILLVSPFSFISITLSMLIVFILLVLIVMNGTFSRKESVQGYLTPNKGIINVKTPVSGYIETHNVVLGQQVVKGEILLVISAQEELRSAESVNNKLINQILKKKKIIKQTMKDNALLNSSELKQLKLSNENLKKEIKQISNQINWQKEQASTSYNSWQEHIEYFNKNLITINELTSKKNSYLQDKANLDLSIRQKTSLLGEKIEIEKQIEQLPIYNKKITNELHEKLASLDERLINLESNNTFTISAPISGRITSINANSGNSISANETLFKIIPENANLFAELYLPSRAIGFVEEGQNVLLRYSAFPYQRYGLYTGKIMQIAQSTINPGELNFPLYEKVPVYKVKVELDSQVIKAYGKQFNLQAGMSVAAEIIIEKRSLFEWVFSPLQNMNNKAKL